MKRRILCLVLAMLMLLAMAACGGETTPSEEPAANEPTQAPSTENKEPQPPAEDDGPQTPDEPADPELVLPLTEETVDLTFWTIVMPDQLQFAPVIEDTPVFQTMKERTNVNVEFIGASFMNASELFSVMVASNEFYDILENVDNYYNGGAIAALDEEVILDITDLIDSYMPHYKAMTQRTPENAKNTVTDDGRHYAVMAMYEDDVPAAWGLGVRQDLVEKAGGTELLEKGTVESYYELAKLLAANGCSSAIDLQTNGGMGFSFASAWGISGPNDNNNKNLQSWYVTDGEVRYGCMQPEYREYLQYMRNAYADGLINKDFYVNTNDRTETARRMLAGETGIFFTNLNGISQYDAMAEDPDFKIIAIADPTMEEGGKNHLRYYSDAVSFYGHSISTTCENPEIAAKWMDYWYTDEGALLMNYGIEGTTYNMVEGEPVFTDLILSNPEGLSLQNALIQNVLNKYMGFLYWDRAAVGYTEGQLLSIEVWMIPDNDYSYPLFATLTSDENAEFTGYYSDISTFVEESTLNFILGYQNIDDDAEWEAYLNWIDTANIQRCIELKTAAYERYLAR